MDEQIVDVLEAIQRPYVARLQALVTELEAALAASEAARERLAGAAQIVIESVDEQTVRCREMIAEGRHSFCEDFGCFDLIGFADVLRAALAAQGDGEGE